MPFGGVVLFAALGALGVATMGLQLAQEGVPTMEGMHYVMIAVFIVVGYALGRVWATPAHMVGLP